MADPDSASARFVPPPRPLAARAPGDDGAREIAPPIPQPPAARIPELATPLAIMLEALAALPLDRGAMACVLEERLGDPRMLALLAHGETASAVAQRVAQCVRIAAEDVRRLLAERPDDVQARLAHARAAGPLRFGEVLLAQGVVAARRLEAALESHKSSGRRIGEELVSQGQIVAREVAEALWLQHKLVAAAVALMLLPGRARDAGGPRLVHARP